MGLVKCKCGFLSAAGEGCLSAGAHLPHVAGTPRFGVATADHQCEAYGGHDDIRDVWERVRGFVPRGKATDFWNRYREDVELARSLGCTMFRLSLSWARLEPESDAWSDEAFAHYRDVLQAIRDAGMSAVVTLVHNTLATSRPGCRQRRRAPRSRFP